MATTYTVADTYSLVCDVLLEPYDPTLGPSGLILGIVTLDSFLALFADVCEDFVNRAGLQWTIYTQQLILGTAQYPIPQALNQATLAFVGGVYVEHSTLADLDDWQYDWQGMTGTPEYWHQDGLPPKTIEVAPNPDYQGANYSTDAVQGMFNGATIGQFTGFALVAGTSVTWETGPLFDTNWNNYSGLNFYLDGTAFQIDTVTDQQNLTLTVAPGDALYAWRVGISNDGNLTLVAATGLESITYALTDIVPAIPDSACFYLAYGILARLFSTDGECKDMQRSYYCQARYTEGIAALAGISGEMLQVS